MSNNNGRTNNGHSEGSPISERDWRLHIEDRVSEMHGELKQLKALLDAHLHIEAYKHRQDIAQQQQIDDLVKVLNQIQGGKKVALGLLAGLGGLAGIVAWLWDKAWAIWTHAGGK